MDKASDVPTDQSVPMIPSDDVARDNIRYAQSTQDSSPQRGIKRVRLQPPPASPSSFDEDRSNFSGFGEYIQHKNNHVRTKMAATAPQRLSNIFSGVIIHVNGDTRPKSKDELCDLVAQHGGTSWYRPTDRDRPVTHTITHKLAQTKIAAIAAGKQAVHTQGKVVSPAWILDSIAANRRLPEGPYLIVKDPRQNQIDKFVSTRPGQDASTAVPPATNTGQREQHAMNNADDVNVLSLDTLHTDRDASHVNVGSTRSTAHAQQATSDTSSSGHHATSTSIAANVSNFHLKSRLHQMGVMRKAAQDHVKASLAGDAGTSNNATRQGDADRTGDLARMRKRIVLHIDLDCFFAQVEELNNPSLKGKPVAVSWADGDKGTGSISCANYAARSHGVKNGSWITSALEKCPDLQLVPYHYDAYMDKSRAFYNVITLPQYGGKVRAVSCDEALLEISHVVQPLEGRAEGGLDASAQDDSWTALPSAHEFTTGLRAHILKETSLHASAGVAESILLARMSLRDAKPNGQCILTGVDTMDFLKGRPIDELPQVGWNRKTQMHELGIHTISDLQQVPLERLQREFGDKVGMMYYKYSRGIDDRDVLDESDVKSFSSEASYGVRTKSTEEAYTYVEEIAIKALQNMLRAGFSARRIQLKVYRTKMQGGAEHGATRGKLKGHGPCTIHSTTHTFLVPTQEKDLFLRAVRKLYDKLAIEHRITPEYNRGFGVQLDTLESAFAAKLQPTIEDAFKKAPVKPVSRRRTTGAAAQEPALVLSDHGPCRTIQSAPSLVHGAGPSNGPSNAQYLARVTGTLHRRQYCGQCTFTYATVMCTECDTLLCLECDQERHRIVSDHSRPQLCADCFSGMAVHMQEDTQGNVRLVCEQCVAHFIPRNKRDDPSPRAGHDDEPPPTAGPAPHPEGLERASIRLLSTPMDLDNVAAGALRPWSDDGASDDLRALELNRNIRGWVDAAWIHGPDATDIEELCSMLEALVTQSLQVDVACSILRVLRRVIVNKATAATDCTHRTNTDGATKTETCFEQWAHAFNTTILPYVQCYVESVYSATLKVQSIPIPIQ
eukprot:m.25735 g.25735  ORF g.25735 m.25735 type:complete len:1065 (+) comp4265_c0_seq1:228-3422(+)